MMYVHSPFFFYLCILYRVQARFIFSIGKLIFHNICGRITQTLDKDGTFNFTLVNLHVFQEILQAISIFWKAMRLCQNSGILWALRSRLLIDLLHLRRDAQCYGSLPCWRSYWGYCGGCHSWSPEAVAGWGGLPPGSCIHLSDAWPDHTQGSATAHLMPALIGQILPGFATVKIHKYMNGAFKHTK